VPMHKIPNIPLGKVQQRHVVRLYLPRLYNADWQVGQLAPDKLAQIYDRCLRPTMMEAVPESCDKWPTSYATAYAQSRTRTGSLTFSSADIPWYRLDHVATTLIAKLADLGPAFRDAYFGHELRGTKGATIHNGRDEDERRLAMEELFEHVDVDSLNAEQWHVDVGLTISVPGHIVTWRESSHHELLSHLMPAASAQQISRLINNKARFHLDRTLQIKEFAGFRATTARCAGASGLSYVQAYCTEKNVTYSLNPGVFRRRQAQELLQKETEDRILKDMDVMSNIFFECAGEGDVEGRDGCARLEIRVPLADAMNSLYTLPEELIQRSVIAIDRRVWW
ncbi:uncharacterized protein EDB93DRAFT_1095501, partial [Suillus bovinus]|uniref:uncharacterized protein n=1 Tax=Suillus bovinus TaxID=48563 RepID=UPI001B873DC3